MRNVQKGRPGGRGRWEMAGTRLQLTLASAEMAGISTGRRGPCGTLVRWSQVFSERLSRTRGGGFGMRAVSSGAWARRRGEGAPTLGIRALLLVGMKTRSPYALTGHVQ